MTRWGLQGNPSLLEHRVVMLRKSIESRKRIQSVGFPETRGTRCRLHGDSLLVGWGDGFSENGMRMDMARPPVAGAKCSDTAQARNGAVFQRRLCAGAKGLANGAARVLRGGRVVRRQIGETQLSTPTGCWSPSTRPDPARLHIGPWWGCWGCFLTYLAATPSPAVSAGWCFLVVVGVGSGST